MPFPMAHGLVGASITAFCRPDRTIVKDWKFLMLGVALAVSPDLDFFFVWVLHLRKTWHRGFTHSIAFALLATAATVAISRGAYLKEITTCGLAVLSHGMLDFLTTKQDGGVELLWPLLRQRYKLGLIGLSESGLSYQSWFDPLKESLKMSLSELAIFGPLLLFVLVIRRPAARFWKYLSKDESHAKDLL